MVIVLDLKVKVDGEIIRAALESQDIRMLKRSPVLSLCPDLIRVNLESWRWFSALFCGEGQNWETAGFY